VVADRPLVVLEVQERGLALLERCRETAELRALRPAERKFLRRLAELGIVELRPVPVDWPAVSLLIPVRDRPRQLAACLEAVARLDYPADRLEVTVVDDCSAPLVQAGDAVRVVRLPSSVGPASARNLGARESPGELLAFLDSDCRPDPDWLTRLVAELSDPTVAAAGGRVLAASQRSWLERYEAVRSPLDLGPNYAEARPRRPVPYLVSASLVVRRAAFEAAGGFDAGLRFGEDVDLCWRLSAAGHQLAYQPLARVRHDHRGDLRDFVSTRASYGAAEAALLRRHPENRRWLGLNRPLLLTLAALLARPALLPLAGLELAAETLLGAARLRREAGLPVQVGAAALLRGQAAGAYHLGRQLTRYYGLPLGLAALRHKRLRKLVLAGLLGSAAVDWMRLRPALSPVEFAAAQALDDLSYQLGCLRGCLRHRTLAPLRVDLVFNGRRRRGAESL
jgi:mycofactocin system glycosyltransferase